MKKKYILIAFLIIILVFVMYKLIEVILFNQEISKLKEYKLKDGEKINIEFKYKKYNYLITNYNDTISSYYNNSILLKIKKKYYLLGSIKKCDMNSFIDNNKIYVHCIGKNGNINRYIINDTKINKDTIKLDYSDTPNISQIHLKIDNIDNKYIYLSSNVKMDDKVKEGNKIRCLMNSKKCKYY